MFENILGNEKNKEILKKTVELSQISHSYLFWGIEGIDKKLIAMEFAQKILCINEKKENCNCKSCIEFESNNNPDFSIINADEGKIKIEQIRKIQRKIAEKPIKKKKKVYIINDADKMTTEAQNCLLKTLEEPPEYITMILICSNENNLLSTIKSRCTRIYFEPIEIEKVKKYIMDNHISENVNGEVLELSQGSIGKALKILEHQSLYENLEKILEHLSDRDLIDIISMSEEIYKSKEEIHSILEYMNVLALKLSKKNITYINCIDKIEETKKRLKANSNYDMCIDNLLFNMWEEVNEKNNRS